MEEGQSVALQDSAWVRDYRWRDEKGNKVGDVRGKVLE